MRLFFRCILQKESKHQVEAHSLQNFLQEMPLNRLHRASRVAFFLCDVQSKFAPHIYQYAPMKAIAAKMITASNILNVPLVVTEHMRDKLGSTDPDLNITKAAILLPKSTFSMLTPQVEDAARKLYASKGIDHVILFGIESQVCVLQTALDLLSKGIGVTVLQDGVSSINPGEIPIALARMRQAGAHISTSESVLFQIMQDASHPGFKQIQQLLKDSKKDTTEALNAFSSVKL
ncbi:Isochorismatase-like protein [Chytriomyces sp. MP71]|nr:Isochorismatase-like protein [Chytriomyces sp. MP71]